jgi:hypothetical protein
MAMTAAISVAGDLSLQPADSMNITNSATKLLPQSQAAESSWMSGLHVSGYVGETFGMWQNPHNTHEWTHSSNARDGAYTVAGGRKLPAQRAQHLLRP